MENLKNKILELLKANLLLDNKIKKHISERLDSLNKIQLSELVDLLQKGLEITATIFQKKIKKDPNFISKLKHIKSNIKREKIKEFEDRTIKEDAVELANLEEELLNL